MPVAFATVIAMVNARLSQRANLAGFLRAAGDVGVCWWDGGRLLFFFKYLFVNCIWFFFVSFFFLLLATGARAGL